MDWLFRRHFWIVHLVFLALCASIVALTVNTLVEFRINEAVIEQPISKRTRKKIAAEAIKHDYSLINERNFFEGKRENVRPVDAAALTSGLSGRWQDAVATSKQLRLVSTAVFLNPTYSLTTIQDLSRGASSTAQTYSINKCAGKNTSMDPLFVEILGPEVASPLLPCHLLGDFGVIRRIEESTVYFFNKKEKRFEYLAMTDKPQQPVVPQAYSSTRSRFGKKQKYGKSIRKTGSNSYEIDATDLDSALENLAEISTQARAVPAFRDGKSVGFRLINIKPGSIFENIGLKNGDVVTHINGYELNSPDKGLELYQKLKTSGQFSVTTDRGELLYSVLGRN